MIAKRCFDVFASTTGLVVLFPVLLAIGAAIYLSGSGPVLFRQERVGLRGALFKIHKFRTMRVEASHDAPLLTIGADPRITSIGAVLRRYKLDELPQLFDVLIGKMSIVGPRPEVPRYVALYSPTEREVVLSVRPGITDRASIRFRNENEVLGSASDPEREYIEYVLPEKCRLYVEYVRTRTFWLDLQIIAETLFGPLRDRTRLS